ncbi:YD repeat protein, partial [Catenovulum agarivorans DS-2]
PDKTYTFDKLGKLLTLESNEYVQSYGYNALGLLEEEQLQLANGKTYEVSYSYNSLGHRDLMLYPDHDKPINYKPNILGQPTQLIIEGGQTFVKNGVSYHANGAIKQFTYGNGVIHNTTLTIGQLPETISDLNGNSIYNKLTYSYDANKNINRVTDGSSSYWSINSLSYDGLD